MENEIRELMGRTIEFPSGYVAVPSSAAHEMEVLLSKPLKVVTYVDEMQSCNECTLNALKECYKQISLMDKEHVAYIVVFCCDDLKKLQSVVEKAGVSFPIICYQTDVFKAVNELDVLACNRTFLIDEDSRIILVGEPFDYRRKNIQVLS